MWVKDPQILLSPRVCGTRTALTLHKKIKKRKPDVQPCLWDGAVARPSALLFPKTYWAWDPWLRHVERLYSVSRVASVVRLVGFVFPLCTGWEWWTLHKARTWTHYLCLGFPKLTASVTKQRQLGCCFSTRGWSGAESIGVDGACSSNIFIGTFFWPGLNQAYSVLLFIISAGLAFCLASSVLLGNAEFKV